MAWLRRSSCLMRWASRRLFSRIIRFWRARASCSRLISSFFLLARLTAFFSWLTAARIWSAWSGSDRWAASSWTRRRRAYPAAELT